MASLRYVQPSEDDPGIGFSLELLGYESGRGLTYETAQRKVNFEFNFDWFVCQLWIEILGKKIEPRTNSMDYQELPHFIEWLRQLQFGKDAAFETIEPFFRMEFRPAYGMTYGYLHIYSGVAVGFPVTGPQIIKFANELEREFMNLQNRYSKDLELWNEYKTLPSAGPPRKCRQKGRTHNVADSCVASS